MKAMKIVVVGGIAGGATAAARLARITKDVHITVLERGPDVSFANCGLPYHIGGEIKDRGSLLLHNPQSLAKATGIHCVRTLMNVETIDRSNKTVTAKNLQNGRTERFPYDKLLLSTGAAPIVPRSIPNIDDKRIVTLRSMQDMDKIIQLVRAPHCKRVTVIGAGFIGLEVAEQLCHLQKKVTIVEKGLTVIPQADEEMSALLHPVLRSKGIDLMVNDGLQAFEVAPGNDPTAPLNVALESGTSIAADAVVLSIGVRPESQLAAAAGIKLNQRGLIVVNDVFQTNDQDIYAVGDVVETADAVFPERRAWVPLGNVANTQARIAANHMLGHKSTTPYNGSIGTCIVRCFDMALGVTGWNEKRLKAAGIKYGASVVNGWDHANYYPGATQLTVKMLYDPDTGRVLGGQACGKQGVDKRLDIFATAIMGKLTIDQLALGQFAYAPPFGSAKDVVCIACLNAQNMRDGMLTAQRVIENDPKRPVLDVRPPAAVKNLPLPLTDEQQKQSKNVLFSTVPDVCAKGEELDAETEYQTICLWGRTGYFAHRFLMKAGYRSSGVQGGAVLAIALNEVENCRKSGIGRNRKTAKL